MAKSEPVTLPSSFRALMERHRADTAVQECLEAFAKGHLKFMPALGPVQMDVLRRSYDQRALINAEMNESRILGLSNLVANLNNSEISEAVIQTMRSHEEKFVIVTDTSQTVLFGIYHIRKGADEPFDYDLAWPY